MTKLKLGPIPDNKPVKLTLELTATLHCDLIAYGEILGREAGQGPIEPSKLVVPMLKRFIVTDRGLEKTVQPADGCADFWPARSPTSPWSNWPRRLHVSTGRCFIKKAASRLPDDETLKTKNGRSAQTPPCVLGCEWWEEYVLTVRRRPEDHRLKMALRSWPISEDQDARISLLAPAAAPTSRSAPCGHLPASGHAC